MKTLVHLTLLSLLFATSAVHSNTFASVSDAAATTIPPAATPSTTPATITPSPPTTTPSPTPATTPSPTSATTPSTATTTITPSPPTTTPSPTPATTPSPTSATTPSTATTTITPSPPATTPSITTTTVTPSTTPPASTVPVSSTVSASSVTPTESKSSTVAKTTPVAATNATSPVSGNSSSTAPSPTTNGSTVTPSMQSNSSEAVTPGTSDNVTSSQISTPNAGPTVPSSPCQGAPCKGDSSCVSLNNTHFCLCSLGYYYNSSTCRKGKLFPGNIIVELSETSDLGNGNSMAYQDLHIRITDFFKNIFDNSDYGQTVIDEVSISPSARSEMRAGGNGVLVDVLNIFAETTNENEETVSESIRKAINSTSYVTTYAARNLCDYYGCEQNGQDNCSDGLLCKCKQGMERPNPQVPVCVASALQCPDTCNADHNKQCLVNKDGGNPECRCLPGYKEGDGEICQECAFGYSGVDCEDKFQLILTIVGSIGGALILCLVIALIVLASSKNKNKNIEEENLIENDFQNLRLQQTMTGFSNLGAEGSIFPKVRANVSSQPQNPYAHQRSMPRPDY